MSEESIKVYHLTKSKGTTYGDIVRVCNPCNNEIEEINRRVN